MTGVILTIFAVALVAAAVIALVSPSTALRSVGIDGRQRVHDPKTGSTSRSDTLTEKAASATRATGLVAGLVGGTIIALAITVMVPARTVGVVTAFGKPTGTLPNGLHVIKPWEKVEKMDASLQTNRYSGDSAIGVRLANQSEAKADASIQWQLREEDAERMYLDYREFERIHTDLVERKPRP